MPLTSEQFVRVLNGNSLWLRSFRDPEEGREALFALTGGHNRNWILQRRGENTPTQVREAQVVTLEDTA